MRIVAVVVAVSVLVVIFFNRSPSAETVAPIDSLTEGTPVASRQPALTAIAAGGYVEARRRAMLYPGRDGVVAQGYVVLGQRVIAGKLLLELDTEIAAAETAAALADAGAAQAELDDARRSLERLEQLVQSGAATEDELDRGRYRVQRVGAQLEALRARADLARARLDLSYLRAPFDGAIVRVDLEPGEVVSLFGVQSSVGGIEIADLSEIWVRVDVPEDRVGRVALGAPAQVVVDALGGEPLDAEVVEIAPVADRQSNTIEVAVRVIDPPPLLRPDMSARVTIRATGAEQ
jgi:RND family efflux transporter MFP subunit